MRLKLAASLAALAAAVAIPAVAHHSLSAEYDTTKPVTVKGTVTKVEWMNPHIWIYIDSKDDKGNLVQWQCEGGPPNSLTRQGWTRNSLKAGDNVTIDGLMAKTRENTCNSSRVTLPDGKRVFARSPEDAK